VGTDIGGNDGLGDGFLVDITTGEIFGAVDGEHVGVFRTSGIEVGRCNCGLGDDVPTSY
jgi:hypothetical protein